MKVREREGRIYRLAGYPADEPDEYYDNIDVDFVLELDLSEWTAKERRALRYHFAMLRKERAAEDAEWLRLQSQVSSTSQHRPQTIGGPERIQ